jgi:hypothetical protein
MLDLSNYLDRHLAINAIRAADSRHLWLTPATAAERRAIPEGERLPKPIAVEVSHMYDDTQPDEPDYEEDHPGYYTVTAFRPGKKDKHKNLRAHIKGFDDEAGIAAALVSCDVEDGTPVFIWTSQEYSTHDPELTGVMATPQHPAS